MSLKNVYFIYFGFFQALKKGSILTVENKVAERKDEEIQVCISSFFFIPIFEKKKKFFTYFLTYWRFWANKLKLQKKKKSLN